MAAMRMPGTLCVIWFVRPWPMNPAPTIPTRIGRPSRSLDFSALSTIITVPPGDFPSQPGALSPPVLPLALALSGAHFTLQFHLDLVQRRPRNVLGRHLLHRKRPLQPQPGVVVEESPFGRGRVELTHLVAGFRGVGEHLIAV